MRDFASSPCRLPLDHLQHRLFLLLLLLLHRRSVTDILPGGDSSLPFLPFRFNFQFVLDRVTVDAVVLVEKGLLWRPVCVVLDGSHRPYELDAVADAPGDSGPREEPLDGALDYHDLGQVGHVLQHAKFLQRVLVQNFEDAVHIPKIAIVWVYVDRQPAQVLLVSDQLDLLSPPILDNAHRPELLISLLELVED